MSSMTEVPQGMLRSEIVVAVGMARVLREERDCSVQVLMSVEEGVAAVAMLGVTSEAAGK